MSVPSLLTASITNNILPSNQARRRILAPAHRAASGPTTTAPFPPANRHNSLAGILDPAGRRSSMPSQSSLQLYHPMTLQSMPHSAVSHHSDYPSSGRSMLSVPSRGSHQLGPASGIEINTRHHMSLYPSGQGPHSAGPISSPHYMSSDVPLSAPPSLPTNHFSSHHSSHGQNVYPSYSSRHSTGPGEQPPQPSHYFNEGHSHPGSTSGSGYATPQ